MDIYCQQIQNQKEYALACGELMVIGAAGGRGSLTVCPLPCVVLGISISDSNKWKAAEESGQMKLLRLKEGPGTVVPHFLHLAAPCTALLILLDSITFLLQVMGPNHRPIIGS